ncbi:MAG TPA: rhodanese-like domain-containing protein [Candidatus Dependentiae bacterium]|nr:rhodanese-like domain-containing protein [Candidatus Dependentiae bacterium]HRQ62681.1 rhodanese-like domain-containing protein [Candidatus Dependentiae bacterium]
MKKLVIINVLPQESYHDCHISGSINVPLDQIETWAHTIAKDTPIVVYCASYVCAASAHAWEKLDAMGFQEVWVFTGGMNEWYHAKLPVEGVCSLPYLVSKIEQPEEEKKSAIREINLENLKKMMARHEMLAE